MENWCVYGHQLRFVSREGKPRCLGDTKEIGGQFPARNGWRISSSRLVTEAASDRALRELPRRPIGRLVFVCLLASHRLRFPQQTLNSRNIKCRDSEQRSSSSCEPTRHHVRRMVDPAVRAAPERPDQILATERFRQPRRLENRKCWKAAESLGRVRLRTAGLPVCREARPDVAPARHGRDHGRTRVGTPVAEH